LKKGQGVSTPQKTAEEKEKVHGTWERLMKKKNLVSLSIKHEKNGKKTIGAVAKS